MPYPGIGMFVISTAGNTDVLVCMWGPVVRTSADARIPPIGNRPRAIQSFLEIHNWQHMLGLNVIYAIIQMDHGVS